MIVQKLADGTTYVLRACEKASPGMWSDLPKGLILLAVGFLLTSVLGSIIAGWVQRRMWQHQWRVQRNNAALEQAQAVFDELSRLLDRRLFWLTQFQLWTRKADAARLAVALKNYRRVIIDWNESINRNLAMLQIYFGDALREQLDEKVGRSFVAVGADAETLYRTRAVIDEGLAARISDAVERLRLQVYQYNLDLLRHIEKAYRARP